jgi:uracil-DNA glycosylase
MFVLLCVIIMISSYFKSKEDKERATSSGKKIEDEGSAKKIDEEKKRTPEERAKDRFMTFDEFKDEVATWKPLLSKYLATPKFQHLYNLVAEEYRNPNKQIYPPKELIFNCFKRSSLNDIKVVIVGQDPYHQPGQAMGLCFSVNRGVKVPPSLVNIYKAIAQDPGCPGFVTPNHGDLTKWADQGVLLLNTVLTVEYDKPNSHQKFGWLDFTNEVIKIIATQLDNIIFVLWGAPAEKKREIIDKAQGKTHHILTAVHPSPLSASKGFFECRHFSKINEILKQIGKPTIDWSLP